MATWNQVSNIWSAVTSQVLGHCTVKVRKHKSLNFFDGTTVHKRIYLVTWNVHGSGPPSNLSELLDLSATTLPDIYAIGLQELGSEDWEPAFIDVLRPFDYVKVKSRRLWGISITLFVKRSHLPFICSVESEVTKTGFGGYWGNKGAASIRLDFMGMNLIVVSCHLAAHTEDISDRLVHINNILDSQKFKDWDSDNIMDHDYIFWMGDLNFRLENISFNRVLDLIHKKDYKTLKQSDQLHLVMEEGLVFEGFHEAKLSFSPTYKFDVGADTYDTSVIHRVPSYTDRILYHFHDTHYGKLKLYAKAIRYHSHPTFRNSDHKPVSAIIEFSVLSRGTTSPVTFNVGTEPWRKLANKEVQYTVRKNFTPSIGDWIGIYKADFVDFSSYVTYVWTSTSSALDQSSSSSIMMKVQFTSLHLSDLSSDSYVLCYMTRKGSLCGISKTFTIRN